MIENEFDNWYGIINDNIQPIKNIFDQTYKGEGIILDVGGNVGAFTDYVLSKYPNAEVHIFEPVSKFTSYLENKYKNTSVKFTPKGISDIQSKTNIKCDPTNLGWNEISNEGEEISLITLDEYIKDNNLTNISFIKIDVEFYEPFVLNSMKNYIRSTKNLPIIIIEHNYNLSPYKEKQNEVFEWLFKYYEEFDYKFYSNTEDVILIPKQQSTEKLPISIGILAWNSGQTLVNTLESYYNRGLLDIVNDVTILFQEVTDEDKQIANYFGIKYIGLNENIGIGKAFIELANNSQTDHILLLEHDWLLIEDKETTYNRLKSGLELLDKGFSTIRYRHRTTPGYPLFSENAYKGRELEHFDAAIGLTSPHLLDSIHWIDAPEINFPGKIQKIGEYFTTTSRWGNWTNNPCLFKKDFYLQIVNDFVNNQDLLLEPSISKWWAHQDFKVAQGEGLFKHEDLKKYEK
jgi:FkbM family methyltransferase